VVRRHPGFPGTASSEVIDAAGRVAVRLHFMGTDSSRRATRLATAEVTPGSVPEDRLAFVLETAYERTRPRPQGSPM
jgi:hypothetical protein